MDDIVTVLRRYASGSWRRRWIALGVAWLICLAGWAGVMRLSPSYEADAQVYVSPDSVLRPLLVGAAGGGVDGGGVGSGVVLLQRTLLSRPNLETLITEAGLLRGQDTATARDELVKRLAATIQIIPDTETGSLLTIAYRNADPRLAFTIVQTLLGIFVDQAIGSGQTDLANAQRFLDGQIALYRGQLRDIEQRRAGILAEYGQLLPAANGSVSEFDTTRTNVRSLDGRLQDAEARVAMLERKLGSTPQTLVIGQGAAARTSANVPALAAAEENLTELRQRFTEEYPGVITARKLVAALAAAKGSAAIPTVEQSVPNPIYDQLQLQLIDAQTSELSLHRGLVTATAERDHLAALARSHPGLQAEFSNLDHEYEILRSQYDDLLSRRESMQIAAAANVDASSVRVRVVNPPQLPIIPVAPPRNLLLAAVLLVGLGGGAGVALSLAYADSCCYTLQDLRGIGVPIAGGISLRRTPVPHRQVLPALAFGAGLFLLVVAFAGFVAGAGHVAGLA